MRISDWSADVCSSDLERSTLLRRQAGEQPIRVDRGVAATMRRVGRRRLVPLRQPFAPPRGAPLVEEDPPADPHDPGGISALSPVVAGALPGAAEAILPQIVSIAARSPPQAKSQTARAGKRV